MVHSQVAGTGKYHPERAAHLQLFYLYMYTHMHTITDPDTPVRSSQFLILFVIQPQTGLSIISLGQTEFIRTVQKFSGEPRSNPSFHRTLLNHIS